MLEDDKPSEEEDEGSDGTGNKGGDQPGEDNGSNTTPLDSGEAKASNTGTSNGSDDGVGSGNRESAGGGKEDPSGGADEGADHGEHEQLGLLFEETDIDETAFDSVGGRGTHEESTEELADRGNEDGLLEVQGARTDSGTERVTDIVGSDTETVHEGKDHAEGKEEGVITGEHHFGKECGGWVKERGK